jgi:hypothetical protein
VLTNLALDPLTTCRAVLSMGETLVHLGRLWSSFPKLCSRPKQIACEWMNSSLALCSIPASPMVRFWWHSLISALSSSLISTSMQSTITPLQHEFGVEFLVCLDPCFVLHPRKKHFIVRAALLGGLGLPQSMSTLQAVSPSFLKLL